MVLKRPSSETHFGLIFSVVPSGSRRTALAHNAAIFREVLGAGVRLGGVLKGNAYGHGFAEVLPATTSSI